MCSQDNLHAPRAVWVQNPSCMCAILRTCAHSRSLTRANLQTESSTRPPMWTSPQTAQGPKPANPHFSRAFSCATHADWLARPNPGSPTDRPLFPFIFNYLFYLNYFLKWLGTHIFKTHVAKLISACFLNAFHMGEG